MLSRSYRRDNRQSSSAAEKNIKKSAAAENINKSNSSSLLQQPTAFSNGRNSGRNHDATTASYHKDPPSFEDLLHIPPIESGGDQSDEDIGGGRYQSWGSQRQPQGYRVYLSPNHHRSPRTTFMTTSMDPLHPPSKTSTNSPNETTSRLQNQNHNNQLSNSSHQLTSSSNNSPYKSVHLPQQQQQQKQQHVYPNLSKTTPAMMATTSKEADYLRLNVSGTVYKILQNRMSDREEKQSLLTRLCQMDHLERMKHVESYVVERDEYFISRPPKLFDAIYDYHATGELHCPPDTCRQRFLTELDFWRINPSHMSDCCAVSRLGFVGSLPPTIQNSPVHHTSHSMIPTTDTNGQITTILINNTNDNNPNNIGPDGHPILKYDEFQGICFSNMRRVVWQQFEDPQASLIAKGIAFASVVFIIASIAGLILGSLPNLQDEHGNPHFILIYVEYVCISWFTMEYSARWLATPNKCWFMKIPLNIVDLITILPFFIELALADIESIGLSGKFQTFRGILLVMRIMRVLRVARLFKLARYSSGLRSFGSTVKNSGQELGMLLLFLLTAIIFFSTIVYFLEKDEEESEFTSIPAASWWCVITMTTVGYGDLVPKTLGGKIIASFASISGVLVLAFPITMIVDNFAQHYQKKDHRSDKSTVSSISGAAGNHRRRMGKFV